MAYSSSTLLHSLPVHCPSAFSRHHSPLSPLSRRNLSLFILSPAISTLAFTPPSRAQDIPIFGLRKKLKKVEQEAEEIVREGEQVVEKEIQAAEQGIQTAEEEIAGGIGFGNLTQAAAVAGAEAVGVLVGVSVVNGILGPEGKKL